MFVQAVARLLCPTENILFTSSTFSTACHVSPAHPMTNTLVSTHSNNNEEEKEKEQEEEQEEEEEDRNSNKNNKNKYTFSLMTYYDTYVEKMY